MYIIETYISLVWLSFPIYQMLNCNLLWRLASGRCPFKVSFNNPWIKGLLILKIFCYFIHISLNYVRRGCLFCGLSVSWNNVNQRNCPLQVNFLKWKYRIVHIFTVTHNTIYIEILVTLRSLYMFLTFRDNVTIGFAWLYYSFKCYNY